MASKSYATPVYLDFDYKDGGGNKYTATPHYLMKRYVRTATDVPNHKMLEQRGVNATGPLVTTIEDARFTPGAHTLKNINKYDSWYGRTTTVRRFATVYAIDKTLPSSGLKSSVNNKALIGVIKKIREHQQSGFSGPTFLGEFRETVKMIRSPFSTIRKKLGLFVSLRDRILKDRGKTKNWANVISSTWLEFAFGVQPAVSDINQICEMISEQYSKRPGLARVSNRYSDEEVVQFDVSHSYTGEVGNCRPRTRRVIRYSQQYVVGVMAEFPSIDGIYYPAQNLLQYGRFDLSEIVPTAWNLIPFSWLLDYVVNIGDVLECTYDYNSKVRWVCVTGMSDTKSHRFSTSMSTNPAFRQSIAASPEHLYTSYKRIDRSTQSQLGFPEFEFSLPNVGQANNALQLIISLASSNPQRK